MKPSDRKLPQFDNERRQGEGRKFRLARAGRLDALAATCNNGLNAEDDGAAGGTVSLSYPHSDSGASASTDSDARRELEATGAVFGLAPGMTAEDYYDTVWLDTVRLGMRGIPRRT